MADEQTVDRRELQALDLALRQQQAVEGIARLGLGISGGDDVLNFDPQQYQPYFFERPGNVFKRHA